LVAKRRKKGGGNRRVLCPMLLKFRWGKERERGSAFFFGVTGGKGVAGALGGEGAGSKCDRIVCHIEKRGGKGKEALYSGGMGERAFFFCSTSSERRRKIKCGKA